MRDAGPPLPRALAWGISFALVLLALRVGIHLWAAAQLQPAYLLGAMLGAPRDAAGAAIVSFLLLRGPRPALRPLLGLLLWTALMLGAAWSHYVAWYGDLPTPAVLFYLGQLSQIAPSLSAELPLEMLAAWSLLSAAGLVWGPRWLQPRIRSGELRGPARFMALLIVLSVSAPALVQDLRGPFSQGLASPVAGTFHLLWRAARPQPETPEASVEDRRRVRARMPRSQAAPVDKPPVDDVVLIIAESLRDRELGLRVAGRSLTPKLDALAQRGLRFRRLYAAGTTSARALPALLASVPPHPDRPWLHQVPRPAMDCLPQRLRIAGYDTLYAHGGDLSFDMQRGFLRDAGYETILEARDLPPGGGRNAWGYEDAWVFAQVLERFARQPASRPLFATVFTLSHHHPWSPPEGAAASDAALSPHDRYLASLARTDAAIADFVAALRKTPRGAKALVVIVGDHDIPHRWPEDPPPPALPVLAEADPVAALWLDPRSGQNYADRAELLASQLDIAPTLLARLGRELPAHYYGRDLLSEETPPPRLLPQVLGRGAEVWMVRGAQLSWARHRSSGGELVLGSGPESERAKFALRASRFMESLARVLHSDARSGALGPGTQPASISRPAVTAPARTRIVAHRGLGASTVRNEHPENTLASVAAAVRAGATSVEVDLMLTEDEQVVLCHDAEVTLASGETRRVDALSLAELSAAPLASGARVPTLRALLEAHGDALHLVLELKPQPRPGATLRLALRTHELLTELPPAHAPLIDSFDLEALAYMKTLGDYAVSYDVMGRAIDVPLLSYLAGLGIDWLDVHAPLLDTSSLALARRHGFRVMVFTVNDPAWLDPFSGAPPDAVISDFPERFADRP